MKKQLQDYIKIYPNLISQKSCNQTIKELNESEWKLHTYYDPKKDESKSYEKELSISYLDTSTKDELNKIVYASYYKYISDLRFQWFNGWQRHTLIRFNKYDTNTQMKPHCDHIHSIFDGNEKGVPILSCLASLNDDYEGGELIFFEDEKIELKAGSVMVFPSSFLYPHEVKEITKGTRYSFVSWAW